ncbi:flavin-containing monooxygenase [Natribacillus halophilus]|uniref:Predicted flavoprotein CzcO associated with the cation diffusion facilitator CzcD n=1 Tax=Natribacillus halophilus TaxID=549003 RepID=A0A1G8LLL3_9BACI|nr:NAD(P)/FAD-dependent oxidoreductase [Natribacillus halophilus]SDI56568.1 Predicted flavoprotein CzcO associated with the cation diffusion facilitator CzcD [Natribacillus halophilus]
MASHDKTQATSLDVVVIGAGFAGLYALYRFREDGFSTRAYEEGENVGGVWYWSRYPGARCDSESIYYNYTFSDELLQEWTWSSRYPEQPEILSYLNYMADKFDLRQDIQFKTRVTAAHFDNEHNRWQIYLNDDTSISAKYLITGVGCLSATNIPDFKGLDSFEGEWYHTGNWPHEKVKFDGKRVGVIGTGSSGVQSIPVIAQEASHLTVFQRTPQYAVPARNHAYDPNFIRQTKENYNEIKRKMYNSWGALPFVPHNRSALEDTPEERRKVYEDAWQKGGEGFAAATYNDLLFSEESNETASEFIRNKIRETVHDPEVAEKLLPTHYYATKRPILDTYYYETYNRDNVTLLDVKKDPVEEVTPSGVRTAEAEYDLDILVFATGYDGMTGPLFKIDIHGEDGTTLKEKWKDGAETRTYLGMTTAGFPNFFMITGPESPSVLANVPTAIEQHVNWIANCIQYLSDHEIEKIEAKEEAEEAWSEHCNEVAQATLFPKTESWYTGANIAGKPSGRFPIYLAGFPIYRQKCNEVAANGYEGFWMYKKEMRNIEKNHVTTE